MKGELKKMNDLLVHRGPDDDGYFISGGLGLAMRRLSIIDLTGGRQPMPNEDGSVQLVLNGEIYNFRELRARLEKNGHKFRTRSDTETAVHLYEEKGADFVRDLRGMFALALWDARKKRLILARDRMGKKPLFYSAGNGFLSFASELKSLLADKRISGEIDPRAIDSFLVLQYIPSPLSVFRGVRKLEPASMLIVEKGKMETRKYWDLSAGLPDLKGTPVGEIKEMLYSNLLEATKIRMVSDVPLGAFLSGGIDSSIVVALMSRLSEKPVRTFSIGFREEKFSELRYAREVANMYGTNHTEFTVEAKMIDVLPKIVRHYGEPYADSSALPSYFVSRETRKAVTVALNGDGGDENFGGYMRYVAMNLAGAAARAPDFLKIAALKAAALMPGENAPHGLAWKARKFLDAVLNKNRSSTYMSTISFFKPDEKNALISDAFKNSLGSGIDFAEKNIKSLFEKAAGEDLINTLSYVDLHSYLPECLMTKMDIASMANSLEARSPFLDHKFVEFAFSIPGNLKIKNFGKTKWILKETFKDKLPKSVYARGKQGFGIPLGEWFRGELKDYWRGLCLSEKALSRGYFKQEEVFRLWDEHQSLKRDHGYRMWALLMLELWHNEFADDFMLDHGGSIR